jgi:hypothetical protein
MSASIWLDTVAPQIAGRDADGNRVILVMADAAGAPGFETPSATLWRAAGWGRGLDALIQRWGELRGNGELRRRKFEATVRRATAVRELITIAVQTGDADALVEAMNQAEAAGPGQQIPEPVRRAAGAVARLQNNVLEGAETLLSPLDVGLGKLGTLAKVGLGIYAGFKLLDLIRGK